MNQPRLYWPSSLFIVAVLILYSTPVKAQPCEEAYGCRNALECASDAIMEGNFTYIKKILTECPPMTFVKREHKIRAYELLAQAHYGLDNTIRNPFSKADSMIINILEIEKEYEPQASQKVLKDLTDYVKKKRAELAEETQSNGLKRWLWIGAGAVAAGVTTALLVARGGPKQLPGPPGPPGENK